MYEKQIDSLADHPTAQAIVAHVAEHFRDSAEVCHPFAAGSLERSTDHQAIAAEMSAAKQACATVKPPKLTASHPSARLTVLRAERVYAVELIVNEDSAEVSYTKQTADGEVHGTALLIAGFSGFSVPLTFARLFRYAACGQKKWTPAAAPA